VTHYSFLSTFQDIERQIKYVQEVIFELAINNPIRIQKKSLQFQHSLLSIYEKGEGLIEGDVYRILEAVTFAAKKHRKQLRKDQAQTSYLVHPLSVAHHLIAKGHVRDPDIIIAGLLHDTLEDTATSKEELFKLFGERATSFVQEVTDDKALSKEQRKKLQIATAPHRSAGAAQIRLADKWDNLTDLLKYPLLGWSQKRIQVYFEWAQKVVNALPWVNRLLLEAVEKVIDKRLKNYKP